VPGRHNPRDFRFSAGGGGAGCDARGDGGKEGGRGERGGRRAGETGAGGGEGGGPGAGQAGGGGGEGRGRGAGQASGGTVDREERPEGENFGRSAGTPCGVWYQSCLLFLLEGTCVRTLMFELVVPSIRATVFFSGPSLFLLFR